MSSKAELLPRIESLFFERTFSDLGMEEIARELGMKKASLYYHFPSKEAMILEVLRASFEEYRTFFLGVLERPPADIVRESVEYSSSRRNLFSVIFSKGSCRSDEIRRETFAMISELKDECHAVFVRRFGWNRARSEIFLSLLERLSERRCAQSCEAPMETSSIDETVSIFFTR